MAGSPVPKGSFIWPIFRPLADRDKFIIVCPASKHLWHDGKDNHGIDDIKFISQIIDQMVKKYNANENRIYVTGISNGGFMASRLACQLHSRIAAIAVVAATLDQYEGYAPEKPMPVIYMHGTADPVIPEKGGKKFGRWIYSQDEVLKIWAKTDKCGAKPIITEIPDKAGDGTSIIKKEYINRQTGNKVIGYTIVNGGHTWPGGWQYMPRFIVGKTTKNLNACEVIWEFFKDYSLNSN